MGKMSLTLRNKGVNDGDFSFYLLSCRIQVASEQERSQVRFSSSVYGVAYSSNVSQTRNPELVCKCLQKLLRGCN